MSTASASPPTTVSRCAATTSITHSLSEKKTRRRERWELRGRERMGKKKWKKKEITPIYTTHNHDPVTMDPTHLPIWTDPVGLLKPISKSSKAQFCFLYFFICTLTPCDWTNCCIFFLFLAYISICLSILFFLSKYIF